MNIGKFKIYLCIIILAATLPILEACDSGTSNGGGKDEGKREQSQPVVEIDGRYLAEISEIAGDAKVRTALAEIKMRTSAAREMLFHLTEIPAPPFGEEVRGKRIAEIMREIGLRDVMRDKVGNVIGRWPGLSGKKVIALSAHMDTVFPSDTDVSVRAKDGRFYAPGIADNSRGVVALLEVLRSVLDSDLKTKADILFVATVGEEGLGDLRGVKYLFREGGPQIDTFVAIDGRDIARIVYAGVGSHRYRVTFHGPGGHSWRDFGLANPHHALGRAIAEFIGRAPAVASSQVKTSFNIGRVGGGTSVNSIPFESWMEIDMRSRSPAKVKEMDAVFQSAVQAGLAEENGARTGGPPLTADIQMVGSRPAGETDLKAPLAQRSMAALRRFGIAPKPGASSTDSNIPIALGVPAVTISRGGRSGGAHSPEEWWKDEDSYLGPQIALLIILASAGLPQ